MVLRSNSALLLTIQFASLISSLINIISLLLTTFDWTKVRGIAPRSHIGRPRTCLVFPLLSPRLRFFRLPFSSLVLLLSSHVASLAPPVASFAPPVASLAPLVSSLASPVASLSRPFTSLSPTVVCYRLLFACFCLLVPCCRLPCSSFFFSMEHHLCIGDLSSKHNQGKTQKRKQNIKTNL